MNVRFKKYTHTHFIYDENIKWLNFLEKETDEMDPDFKFYAYRPSYFSTSIHLSHDNTIDLHKKITRKNIQLTEIFLQPVK